MRWRHSHLRDTAHLISRLRRQLPLIGEAFPLRRANPSGAARQLPLTRGALEMRTPKPPLVKGRCRAKRGGEVILPARRYNSPKFPPHLLLTAVVLRQLVANLIPAVSGGAYQDAREVTPEWNARPKHRDLPKIRGRKHQTRPQALFSPPSFLLREKRWGRRRRQQSQICSNLSVSLRLTAPLGGEPFSAAAGYKNFPAAGFSCGGAFLYPMKPTALRQTK